jgi:hypothetical protein
MSNDRRYDPGDAQLYARQTSDPENLPGGYFDTVDDDGRTVLEGPYVSLPHQCGHWVIGGKRQVEQLITDLQTLLPQLADDKPDPI